MKPTVLDIMKYKLFSILIVLGCLLGQAQIKQEREFRIDQKDFPSQAIALISPYVTNSKRVRFYKETDGEKTSFEAKFKKDKLFYSIEFDTIGNLEDIEFVIRKTDIPTDVFKNIANYLNVTYKKVKLKKIQQQYLAKVNNSEIVLKDAFQNLLLQSIRYEIIISAKAKKGFQIFEITFDSQGKQISTRRFSDSKYDHVLY